ncbi:MAG: trehalase family glycosidase [Candidatus Sigynarchaeota archaeon]
MLDALFALKKRKFDFCIAQKPRVDVPDETIVKGFDALCDEMLYNLMPPVGDFSTPWVRPAPKFPGAYLWDSSFIAMAWKIWDPCVATKILTPFVDFQAIDGRMPHMVFWGKIVSKLSNPPFLEWALDQALAWRPDLDVAKKFLEPCNRFITWRDENRFNKDYGLYFWIDSYESGIDNSPRFRSVDEKEDYGTKHLGAIDLNAEMALEHASILRIINRFSMTDGFERFEKGLARIRNAIEERSWDPKTGLFYDLDFRAGKLIPMDTIASYFPLIMDGLDASKVEKIVARLSDPHKYDTLVPLPTVARDAPEFIKDMWRGPVWMNTAYMVIKGLKQQQHGDLAGNMAYRLCKGVYETWRNEGSFYEFYDPDRHDLRELSRKKGNLYKQITLGSKPVKHFAGWTALANTLLVEDVIGLQKDGDAWYIEPHLPRSWIEQGKPIRVTMPFFKASLEMFPKKSTDTIDCKLDVDGIKRHASVENGKKVLLSDTGER